MHIGPVNRVFKIDLKKPRLACDKVLRGYFKCLEDDGALKVGSINDNDIEYLTDKVLEAIFHGR